MDLEKPIKVQPVNLPVVIPIGEKAGIPTRSVAALQTQVAPDNASPTQLPSIILLLQVVDQDRAIETLHLSLTPGAARLLARKLKKNVKKAIRHCLDHTPGTE